MADGAGEGSGEPVWRRLQVACTGGWVWRRSLVSRGDVRFHSTFANVGRIRGAGVAQQVRNRIWS